MEQLVMNEGAAKRDIWKQKVKNLSDEYQSLYKSWEKDARRSASLIPFPILR
jgi:hypothetical protein